MNIPNVASDLISNSKYIHKITHILNTELNELLKSCVDSDPFWSLS